MSQAGDEPSGDQWEINETLPCVLRSGVSGRGCCHSFLNIAGEARKAGSRDKGTRFPGMRGHGYKSKRNQPKSLTQQFHIASIVMLSDRRESKHLRLPFS